MQQNGLHYILTKLYNNIDHIICYSYNIRKHTFTNELVGGK